MSLKKTAVRFQQPANDAALAAEEDRRSRGEIGARGLLDGRLVKRRNRTSQVGLKITEDKKRQYDRLRMLTGMSYTEIFEQALDDFESAWKTK